MERLRIVIDFLPECDTIAYTTMHLVRGHFGRLQIGDDHHQ